MKGINVIIPWYRQKTTYVAIGAVLTAVGAYVGGEIGLVGLLSAVFAAAGTITVRLGIEKSTYIPELKDRGEVVE